MLNIILCIHIVLHISQKFLNKTNGQICLIKLTASKGRREYIFSFFSLFLFFLSGSHNVAVDSGRQCELRAGGQLIQLNGRSTGPMASFSRGVPPIYRNSAYFLPGDSHSQCANKAESQIKAGRSLAG